jgi:hypothetical protein
VNAGVATAFTGPSYAVRMARLSDRTSVGCPSAEAESRVESYFDSRRAPDGVTRMRLRVPLHGVNSLGLSLDREVRVEARAASATFSGAAIGSASRSVRKVEPSC